MSLNPEQLPEKISALEALLFIHGEPLQIKKIATILELPIEDVGELLLALKSKLEDPSRGLLLVSDSQKAQLATKPQFHSFLAGFVKEQITEDLSPASLETLAIVAYFGPISRAKIDYQRGVNSSFILRNLMLRGLVERTPDPTHPSSYLYGPSFDLFKHLGISEKKDLPDYLKYQELAEKLESKEDKKEEVKTENPSSVPVVELPQEAPASE